MPFTPFTRDSHKRNLSFIFLKKGHSVNNIKLAN